MDRAKSNHFHEENLLVCHPVRIRRPARCSTRPADNRRAASYIRGADSDRRSRRRQCPGAAGAELPELPFIEDGMAALQQGLSILVAGRARRANGEDPNESFPLGALR